MMRQRTDGLNLLSLVSGQRLDGIDIHLQSVFVGISTMWRCGRRRGTYVGRRRKENMDVLVDEYE
jgi:hypothetical protein